MRSSAVAARRTGAQEDGDTLLQQTQARYCGDPQKAFVIRAVKSADAGAVPVGFPGRRRCLHDTNSSQRYQRVPCWEGHFGLTARDRKPFFNINVGRAAAATFTIGVEKAGAAIKAIFSTPQFRRVHGEDGPARQLGRV